MDVHAVLGVAVRYWRTIIATFLIVSVAVVAYFMRQPTAYASTSVVNFLPRTGGAAGELKAALDYAQTQASIYAQLARTQTVQEPVAQKLNLPGGPSEVAGSCSVDADGDQAVITVTCRRGDPQSAAVLANAIAEQIIKSLTDFAPAGTTQVLEARQTQRAEPNSAPVAPNLKSSLPMALGLGLVLGIGQAFGRSFLDTRVETPDDVNRITRIPVIGEVPLDEAGSKQSQAPRRIEPFSIRAEAYRRLRTILQFKALEGHGNTVLVTSSVPGEGKTATATAIAQAFAQTGQRVLLMDCDLRRPRIHEEVESGNRLGLSNLLLERGALASYVQNTGGLDVLTSGPKPPNPSELLGSPAMRAVIVEAQGSYDVVVIDSPPLLPVTDAAVVARMGAGVVVVADTGRVRSRQLATGLKNLLTVEAPVLGIVLNKVKIGGVGGYYGYGYKTRYSYDYNYSTESGKARRRVRRAEPQSGKTRGGATRLEGPSDDSAPRRAR